MNRHTMLHSKPSEVSGDVEGVVGVKPVEPLNVRFEHRNGQPYMQLTYRGRPVSERPVQMDGSGGVYVLKGIHPLTGSLYQQTYINGEA